MITKIAHHALKVKNMERSVEFYTKILGFNEAFRFHDEAGKLWMVYLHIGNGQFLELFPDGIEEYQFHPTAVGPSHICYEVEDIQACSDELAAKGIALDNEINKGKSGCLQLWIQDPDGNRIEIMQILPDSMQAKAIRALENHLK